MMKVMRHFKNFNGSIFAYEVDGSQNDLISACIEDGGVELSEAEVDEILNPALLFTTEQTIAQKIAEGDAKVAERLDAQARALGFDNITTAVVNASLPVGEYKQAEGMALLIWRARTWQKAEEIRDEVIAGDREMPTWEEIESELPNYPISQD